jgi:peptidoglycan/LPS O-acetylase OafA/YrhL
LHIGGSRHAEVALRKRIDRQAQHHAPAGRGKVAPARGLTILEKSVATGGRTTGFDYIRIGLAASIILWHGISLSYGRDAELRAWHGPLGIAMHFALPMFFALSGFLVAGSLERCRTLFSFFCLRALRILPALAMEILISALILGPLLTSLPLAAYFHSPLLYAYFLNIAGDIHYELPGLFAHTPTPGLVNAQLWTIPFELQCYLAIGALSLTAALRRRWILLALVLAAQALWIWQAIRLGADGGSGGASGPALVIAFLGGILVHLYQDKIRLRWTIFAAVLLSAVALSALPHGAYYLPLPCAYLTVYLGMTNPKRSWIIASGDYSYGLYLFGYPIQQAIASAGPPFHHWWANVGLGFPAALLVACLSWHGVERPALRLRRLIPAAESRLRRLVARPRVTRNDRAYDVGIGLCGLSAALLFANANPSPATAAALMTLTLAFVRAIGGGGIVRRRAKGDMAPSLQK